MTTKIQKSSSSEVFDIYSTMMSKYLKKRASWASQILEDVVESGKAFMPGKMSDRNLLFDAISSAGKTVEEFIVELSKLGKNPEEIAQLTGQDINKVKQLITGAAAPVAETAPGVAQNVAQTGETATKVTQNLAQVADALEEASIAVKTEGKGLIETAQESKNLEGKSLDEVVKLYEGLKRSRSAMKGQITKLKSELDKAKQMSQTMTEQLTQKDELLRAAEQLYQNSEKEAVELAKKIENMGGQLDEAGNVISSLKGELSSTKDALDVNQQALNAANSTIKELSDKGVQLTAENQRLLAESIKAAEMAGYYRALHEAAQTAGEAETVAGKTAKAIAEEAENDVTEISTRITQSSPSPVTAQVIEEATEASRSRGISQARQAIQEEQSLSEASEASGASEVSEQAGSGRSLTEPSATEPSLHEPTEHSLTEPSERSLTEPSELSEATEATGATEATKVLKGKDKESLLHKLILKNSPYVLKGAAGLAGSALGVMGSGALGLLKFTVIAGLIGGSAYLAWKYFFKSHPDVQAAIKQTMQNQEDLISKLRALKFKPNSAGQQKTNDLLSKLTTSIRYISGLTDVDKLTAEQYNQIMSDLDALDSEVDSYLASKDQIAKDLENPNDINTVVQPLNDLKQNLITLKELMLEANQAQETKASSDQGKSTIPERGITAPVGRAAPTQPSSTPTDTSNPTGASDQHIPQIVKVFGQEIDLGKESSPGFRSAANRIIQKVINTPEGKAFIDPDNIWGGWFPKTVSSDDKGNPIQNKQIDYLRDLKFLYLNKIFDLGDLRRFIRENLPKAGRKRLSGWNQAIKHYMNQSKVQANQKNNDFFTQKFSKSANYFISSVNSNGIIMNKKADQISKEYYQGAISDLADQYAKSYYTGLKGMYDQKPEHTEADFKNLYQVHQETGADLIGESHPESITIADSMGHGGLVENQIEQHRHNTDVAKSMPSGNFRGKHAWVLQNLVKLADHADEQGFKEASDLIDQAIKELSLVK